MADSIANIIGERRSTALPSFSLRKPCAPLHDLPDIEGRDFKYEIKLVELDVDWGPEEMDTKLSNILSRKKEQALFDRYFKTVKTWRVCVWNDLLPRNQQKRLRLFPEFHEFNTATSLAHSQNDKRRRDRGLLPHTKPIPDRYRAFRIGGPLDINICSDQPAAHIVAAEACRLLNKYPGEIKETDFPEVSKTWM